MPEARSPVVVAWRGAPEVQMCHLRAALSIACLSGLLGGVPLGYRLARGAEERPAAPTTAHQHCPMHPTYVADRPGACPICGMRLVPQAAHADGPSTLEGRVGLTLSAERRRLMGLRSEPVRWGALTRSVTALGRVVPDERRMQRVQAPFEGVIEGLRVDATGQLVRRGDRLASLSSPQLVAAQEEFQWAQRAERRLSRSTIPELQRSGRDLLEAARRRLLFWGLRTEDIADLERNGMGRRALDLRAPIDGCVLATRAAHGLRVTPQDTLFEIADLAHVWIESDVAEADVARVRLGQQGRVQFQHLPGRRWSAVVTRVAAAVDAEKRTLQVRLELDNPDGALKPEMRAEVELRTSPERGLLLPESALIPTGERELVFVELDEGRLEPREVRVGRRIGEQIELLAGLRPGERVVVAANFLLDSESSLRAELGGLRRPSEAPLAPRPE